MLVMQQCMEGSSLTFETSIIAKIPSQTTLVRPINSVWYIITNPVCPQTLTPQTHPHSRQSIIAKISSQTMFVFPWFQSCMPWQTWFVPLSRLSMMPSQTLTQVIHHGIHHQQFHHKPCSSATFQLTAKPSQTYFATVHGGPKLQYWEGGWDKHILPWGLKRPG